jgi:hypothetical protein
MSLMGQRAMVTGSNYSKRQEQIGAIISAIICLVVVSDQSLKGGRYWVTSTIGGRSTGR